MSTVRNLDGLSYATYCFYRMNNYYYYWNNRTLNFTFCHVWWRCCLITRLILELAWFVVKNKLEFRRSLSRFHVFWFLISMALIIKLWPIITAHLKLVCGEWIVNNNVLCIRTLIRAPKHWNHFRCYPTGHIDFAQIQ